MGFCTGLISVGGCIMSTLSKDGGDPGLSGGILVEFFRLLLLILNIEMIKSYFT